MKQGEVEVANVESGTRYRRPAARLGAIGARERGREGEREDL